MRKNDWILWLVALMWVLSGCVKVADKTVVAQETEETAFPLPKVPSMLVDTQDRIDYLLLHFWENVDFQKQILSDQNEWMEQAFVNYLSVFRYADAKVIPKAVRTLVRQSLTHHQRVRPFMRLVYKYLYHPNSPMLNEEFYRYFVNELLASDLIAEVHRVRLQMDLEVMDINRVGTLAADFAYITEDGETCSLYGLTGQQTLLMFYNPECDDCKDILSKMKESAALTQRINSHQLQLLLICVEGSEVARRALQQFMPSSWLKGILKGEEMLGQIYILRAMPTLFLLDKEKKVLLKDAPLSMIEQYWQY